MSTDLIMRVNVRKTTTTTTTTTTSFNFAFTWYLGLQKNLEILETCDRGSIRDGWQRRVSTYMSE